MTPRAPAAARRRKEMAVRAPPPSGGRGWGGVGRGSGAGVGARRSRRPPPRARSSEIGGARRATVRQNASPSILHEDGNGFEYTSAGASPPTALAPVHRRRDPSAYCLSRTTSPIRQCCAGARRATPPVEVERCRTLEEAIAHLAATRFDAVLLDLNLPDSHGLQTIDRALAEIPGLPIVVITAAEESDLVLPPFSTARRTTWSRARPTPSISRASCGMPSRGPASRRSWLTANSTSAP